MAGRGGAPGPGQGPGDGPEGPGRGDERRYDPLPAQRSHAPSLQARASAATATWTTTQLPTDTQRQDVSWARDLHKAWRARFDAALTVLKGLEGALDAAGAPHTPGRGR